MDYKYIMSFEEIKKFIPEKYKCIDITQTAIKYARKWIQESKKNNSIIFFFICNRSSYLLFKGEISLCFSGYISKNNIKILVNKFIESIDDENRTLCKICATANDRLTRPCVNCGEYICFECICRYAYSNNNIDQLVQIKCPYCTFVITPKDFKNLKKQPKIIDSHSREFLNKILYNIKNNI